MTLLQNNNNILPLKKGKKVAVIGPNANEKAMLWGNYNGTPFNTITILDGITNKVGKNNVTYLKGCDLVNDKVLNSLYSQCSIDGKPGIKGTFWNNRRREGDPADVTYTANPLSVTTYGGYTFSPNLGLKNFSAKYETVFRPTESGEVTVVVEACGIFEVLVNGEQKVRQRTWRTTETKTPINVEAGKEYKIEILYSEVENWAANVKFNIGTFEDIDFSDVIKQLKGYDTVIFAGGISPQVEGEEMPINLPGFKGGDRTDIELPAVQRKLLKSLKDAGKHIVYVNCSGSAIALQPETETCDAILQAWYGGESGGQAIADVIYGDYNPSGKLPVTFYKNSEQLPDYEDYTLKGRTYRYMNDALFPFGYGLSYTTFNVGEATLSATTVKAGDPITLTVPVRNTGKRDGAEVVQVYVRKVGDTDGPLKTLKNFKRVELKAGKSSNVAMTLDAESFEFFNDDINDLATVAGEYEILYGTSSSDNDLRTIKVNLQ
jgi:beta-glucosidase